MPNKVLTYCIILLFFLVPNNGQSEVLRQNLVDYIKSERSAGRTPDIKGKFGNEFWGTDFSKLDLRGVDLSEAELGSAIFKNATMVGANLSGAHIYLADFEQTNLQQANFTNTKLDRCSFKNADLRGIVKFGCKNSHLGVNAQGVNLEGVDLTRADLANIDLSGANLSLTTLTNASLANTKLHGANFHKAEVQNTIFINSKIGNEKRIQLSEKGAIATKGDMEIAVVNGVDFTGHNFESANFSGSSLFRVGNGMTGVISLPGGFRPHES